MVYSPSPAAEGPFVAGFERFGRPAELAPELAGRLLLSELSCTACHRASDPTLQAKQGPRLEGAGMRLQPEWVRRFLLAPPSVQPGTTMPDVLAGYPPEEKQALAAALTAFLVGQREPDPEVKASGANPVPHEFWKKGDADTGRQLYHQLGCVACHEPDPAYHGGSRQSSTLDMLVDQLEPEEIEELGLAAAVRPVKSVPHGDLSAKYTPQSLTNFLLHPQHSRPRSRMPSFKLGSTEAADLSAYLLATARAPEAAPREPGGDFTLQDRELGRKVFVELRCVSCHSAAGAGEPVEPPAAPLAEIRFESRDSCLNAASRGRPQFQLDPAQTQALQQALKKLGEPGGDSAALHFRLLQLNCLACHEREQRGGVAYARQRFFETAGHLDLGDEGRLPPPLTGTGRKLQQAWLTKVLSGAGDVRPYLQARMPVFPLGEVQHLPELLVQADGGPGPPADKVFAQASGLAEAGRSLLDAGCVQCHPLRGESLPSVVGIDLAGVPSRIQPQWFHDFLLNPGQVKPRTRMPTFFPEGKSSIPDQLGGHVEHQLAAFWTYLRDDKLPLPEKILEARARDFELVPQARPIVMRTFLEGAGTQAIAIGFPARVHLAFDAESVRWSYAWRGRFLDAHGTWYDRSAPPAKPLGTGRIEFPAGPPLALLNDSRQRWPSSADGQAEYRFFGYRLDPAGIPTLRYGLAGGTVEDRMQPLAEGGVSRRLAWRPNEPKTTTGSPAPGAAGAAPASRIWFRALAGRRLTGVSPEGATSAEGPTVLVREGGAGAGVLRQFDGYSDWIVPLRADSATTIIVEYRW